MKLSREELLSLSAIIKKISSFDAIDKSNLLSDLRNDAKTLEIVDEFLKYSEWKTKMVIQREYIEKIQSALFAFSQQDFTKPMEIDERFENLAAIAYSINILGEELNELNQENKKNKIVNDKLLKELSKAMETKDRFLAKMSHEMRTPLNSIIGFTDLLLDNDLNFDVKEKLKIINNQSIELLSLINYVLDLAKIKSDKFSFSPKSVNFKKLIEEKIEPLALSSASKKTKIEFTIDSDVHNYFLIDRVRVGQIFTNLINNAVKFTENGVITVNVSLKKNSNNKQLLECSVQDSGLGISKENISKILQPFGQEYDSSEYSMGSGLGLTIVQELLALMNSSIQIESKKNCGTRIYFELELEKSEFNSEKETAEAFFNLNGKNVLVVDDSEFNRLLIVNILDKWGANSKEATNGAEAIEKMTVEKFDLILMDFQMPVMSGIDATIEIRKNLKNTTPIIGLTANTVKKDLDKSMQIGMNGCVIKPVDKTILIREINKAFDFLPSPENG